MSAQDLLIEIGTEELPPKNLKKLRDEFVDNIQAGLKQAELKFKEIKGFATPRRLAVLVSELEAKQPDRMLTKKGPAKQAAFDVDNNPTKAALGFAESCGVDFKALTLQENPKGAFLVYEYQETGKTTEEIVPAILKKALDGLPIAKRMRWGSSDETFVRPVHWILLLFGENTVPCRLFGIHSGKETRGHRYHHPENIAVSRPRDYEAILLKAKVVADFEKRHENIQNQIQKAIKERQCDAILDKDLLLEVTGLVEWPVVLIGEFDANFLMVPREALISAMEVHQRCFPMIDNEKKLLPSFIVVSNIESIDPKCVVRGNESVMKARLSDAAFHFDMDKKIPLQQRGSQLKNVVFQAGLGSLWDKSERLATLAKVIAQHIDCDPKQAEKASHLSKTDLLTQMVGEFPELQGIMGKYYALHDGESETVAFAIEEHYHPRFAADSLPASLVGTAVALADRIDSLVGIFGIGKKPTGDKDPFALRRQALGVIRMMVEKELDLDLQLLFFASKETYGSLLKEKKEKKEEKEEKEESVISTLLDFCFERFRAWYQEQNIPVRVFEAVLAKRPTKPYDFHCRLQAVHAFLQLPEAESLAAANKRVQNILTKSEVTIPEEATFDGTLLNEPAEKELANLVLQKQKEIAPLIKSTQYTEALKSLATLKDPVDRFFNEVMVMVEDVKLRNNRIKLLNALRALFLEIADISLL